MGLIEKFIGGSAAQPIEAIGNVFDKLFTSDEERAVAEAAMAKISQHPGELQVELNKIEASHRSVFVAGWRPFLGWVCGFGLGNVFIVNPYIQWFTGKPGPVMPTEVMTQLVVAMLGLGGIRMVEKLQGRSK
jgi:hypothetical protein